MAADFDAPRPKESVTGVAAYHHRVGPFVLGVRLKSSAKRKRAVIAGTNNSPVHFDYWRFGGRGKPVAILNARRCRVVPVYRIPNSSAALHAGTPMCGPC